MWRDIAEALFLDGTIIIPQFVLRELQLVADSADPLKRQRGRRGLEVLQRIQKMPHLDVQIAEDDFPHIPEVDMKLIELAKRYDAKVVTNDFNLNKVATLQGIEIMNVNLLANALKPVVLPGEACASSSCAKAKNTTRASRIWTTARWWWSTARAR